MVAYILSSNPTP